MMVVPVDGDIDECEKVSAEQREDLEYRLERRFCRELQLEHHDREDDSNDAICQGIEACGTHSNSLKSLSIAGLASASRCCQLLGESGFENLTGLAQLE